MILICYNKKTISLFKRKLVNEPTTKAPKPQTSPIKHKRPIK